MGGGAACRGTPASRPTGRASSARRRGASPRGPRAGAPTRCRSSSSRPTARRRRAPPALRTSRAGPTSRRAAKWSRRSTRSRGPPATSSAGRSPPSTRWPGPLAPGTVWGVGAASGGGKTTFVASRDPALGRGRRARRGRCRSRSGRATGASRSPAVRVGVYPGDMLSGELRIREQAGDLGAGRAERVCDDVRAMQHDEALREPALRGARPRRSPSGRSRACVAHAAEHDFRVVVVDHIDHVADEDTGALGARRVEGASTRPWLALAQEHGRARARDLAAQRAALPGRRTGWRSTSRRNRRTCISTRSRSTSRRTSSGLFRPLVAGRRRRRAVEGARRDRRAHDVLAPNTMGVSTRRARNYGSREGRRATSPSTAAQARERTADEVRAWEARPRHSRHHHAQRAPHGAGAPHEDP
jgi:hypothetical protein